MFYRLEKIKNFLTNEKDIMGILNTISHIEKSEGKNSLKISSLTGLLKDFLADEEKYIAEFNNDHAFIINYISKNRLSLIDEVEASFLDNNTFIQYRLFKLLKSSLNDIDLIKTDTYLELINTSNNPDLKYKLCFSSPILMDLLIKNNFDHEKVNINEYKDKKYEVKKLSFLIKRCAEFIIFMIENDKIDDIVCLSYLSVLKNNINNETFNNISNILVKSGYQSEKMETIFTHLKEKTYKKLD